jgi:hypothetical protein
MFFGVLTVRSPPRAVPGVTDPVVLKFFTHFNIVLRQNGAMSTNIEVSMKSALRKHHRTTRLNKRLNNKDAMFNRPRFHGY